MNIIDIINNKRLKKELSKEEIDYFIENMMQGNIMDYQISSLLMAIVLNGMTLNETINLTNAMIKSGDIIDLSSINGITIDKHSTGGVGDNVTLVLTPILASLGFYVAKMSGRGLGHTGGTIDKLESIKGYNVALSEDEFFRQVNEHGIAIISQTGTLAKADKKLYALRDVTGTVESIPLIAASIMSKKIASGSNFILIDVKVGKGALMKNIDDAKELARIMIEIGKIYNRYVVCLITNMEEPLGYAIGNGLEVKEAIDVLTGTGPSDLKELVINLACVALKKIKNINYNDALNMVNEVINNKTAYNKFKELVVAQNGDINSIDIATNIYEYKAKQSGYIRDINALKVGEFTRNLGAGRISKEDKLKLGVGIVLNKKTGDYVTEGEKLFDIYYENLDNIDIEKFVSETFEFSNEIVDRKKLIYDIIE